MTPYPDVYAVGDIVNIPMAKAGVFAENAAGVVADDIKARLHGERLERRYEGDGSCYLEFGGGKVAKVVANFLGGPSPTARIDGPSEALADEKVAFADTTSALVRNLIHGSVSSAFVVRFGSLVGALMLIVSVVDGGVAAGRATGSGAGALFVVSAAGGSARELAPVPVLALSPDQNAAIVAEAQPGGTVSLVVRELGSGAQHTIFNTPRGRDPAAPLGFGEAVWPTPTPVVFDWLDDSPCTPPATNCAMSRLESVRPDGTGLQRLSDSGRFPAFGRGSSRLVYLDRYSFFDPGGLVTLASAGGATIRRFGWSSYGPALASDGRTVAWIGGPSAAASADFGPVLRIARGGRQVAHLRVLELGLDGSPGERAPLAWSPDGQTLAFIESTIAQGSRPRARSASQRRRCVRCAARMRPACSPRRSGRRRQPCRRRCNAPERRTAARRC